MFFEIDLNQTFALPFKDAESRRHFLIGCLVSLTAFIIPILPFFFLYGYAVRIVKQILNNETPHMVAWDDWGGMFKDGARMFGVRIIYSIPIMILTAPLFISSIVMPILMGNSKGSEMDALFPALMLVMFCTMCILIPFSFLLAIIIPAAEMHVVDKDEFAAGFRIGEWWPVFRANLGGFRRRICGLCGKRNNSGFCGPNHRRNPYSCLSRAISFACNDHVHFADHVYNHCAGLQSW